MNKKFLPVFLFLTLFFFSGCQKETTNTEVKFIESEPISISSETENEHGKPYKYTTVDLDNNGNLEYLIEYDKNGETLILKEENGAYKAFYQPYRSCIDIKTDGTMNYSNSAFEGGVHQLIFTDDKIENEYIIVYDTQNNVFLVNNESVSKEECEKAMCEQQAKEDVIWKEISENDKYIFELISSAVFIETLKTYSYPESTIELEYCSGAGFWQTRLYFEPDGTFEGAFNDLDMGDISDAYPGGTHLTCSFNGKFDNIKQINEYSYSMTLSYVNTYREPGLEWIEDEIRFISTPPYGVDEGTDFILYLPNTPTKELPEEVLLWIWWNDDSLETSDIFGRYVIHNLETDDVFFSNVFM